MDDEVARKDMFAWYGAAMYAAQLFEVELVTLLLFLQRLQEPETKREDYDRLDKLLSKKTLGALLEKLEEYCDISPEFRSMLNGYREQRNFLAHEFFWRHATKMMTRDGVESMTSLLQTIEGQLREADIIATSMSENARRECGFDEEQVQKLVRKTLESSSS